MKVTIRSATAQDYPAVLDLIREFSLFQGAPEKVTNTAAQMQQDAALFQVFIAELESGDMAGFASFFFAYFSWTGKALYLDDLYVKEAYRKQGIGKQLLEAVVALAKAQNCKKVRWQVSKWNAHAIEFYKRMGATIDEVEINCDLVL